MPYLTFVTLIACFISWHPEAILLLENSVGNKHQIYRKRKIETVEQHWQLSKGVIFEKVHGFKKTPCSFLDSHMMLSIYLGTFDPTVLNHHLIHYRHLKYLCGIKSFLSLFFPSSCMNDRLVSTIRNHLANFVCETQTHKSSIKNSFRAVLLKTKLIIRKYVHFRSSN